MIDSADISTVDHFQPVKRGRGRPVTGNAMTPAEKQRAYRLRKKTGNVTINQPVRILPHDDLLDRIDALESANRALLSELACYKEHLSISEQSKSKALLECGFLGSRLDHVLEQVSKGRDLRLLRKHFTDMGIIGNVTQKEV